MVLGTETLEPDSGLPPLSSCVMRTRVKKLLRVTSTLRPTAWTSGNGYPRPGCATLGSAVTSQSDCGWNAPPGVFRRHRTPRACLDTNR